MMTAMISCHVV
jgi:ElaB/YqjD/DUF883 family membrane-anchored ribosome-binding protein